MTVQTIIDIAKISEYLAFDDNLVSVYKGGSVNKNLSRLIYLVRKGVEWTYDNNASSDDLQQMANYLYTICGKYASQALGIVGGSGGVVAVTTPSSISSPLLITSADFASATEWSDSRIGSTWDLQVFWNDIPRFLLEGSEWQRTSTGIEILIPGFDATQNNYTFLIFISIA